MGASVQVFTPEIASEILGNTSVQRDVIQSHVKWLAGQMKSGAFKLNGETIILTGSIENGVVSDGCAALDGQHRLWACVMAGVPFKSLAVFNISANAFDTIDTGRVRSAKNVLDIELHGRKVPAKVRSMASTAIKIVLAFNQKTLRFDRNRMRAVTNADISKFVREDPSLIDLALDIHELGRPPLPPSHLVAVMYMVSPGFPDAIDDFARPLVTGAGLSVDSPVYKLREKLIAMDRKRFYLSMDSSMHLLIKTWNAHATGKDMKILRHRLDYESAPSLLAHPNQPFRTYSKYGAKVTGYLHNPHRKRENQGVDEES